MRTEAEPLGGKNIKKLKKTRLILKKSSFFVKAATFRGTFFQKLFNFSDPRRASLMFVDQTLSCRKSVEKSDQRRNRLKRSTDTPPWPSAVFVHLIVVVASLALFARRYDLNSNDCPIFSLCIFTVSKNVVQVEVYHIYFIEQTVSRQIIKLLFFSTLRVINPISDSKAQTTISRRFSLCP